MKGKSIFVSSLCLLASAAHARNLNLLTFLSERTSIVTAIVGTEDPEELERALAGNEYTEYLSSLDMYIVHDIAANDMATRVGVFEGLEGVYFADSDHETELTSFAPNDDTSSVLWWLTSDHSGAFTTGSGPFGWDIFREATASTPVGVIDTGIALHTYLGYAMNRDLSSRQSGAYVEYEEIDEEALHYTPAEDTSGHGTAVAGVIAADGNNSQDTLGVSWWGTPVVSIRYIHTTIGLESAFLRGLDWGLGHGIKLFSFQSEIQGEFTEDIYQVVSDKLEAFNALIFWACSNTSSGDLAIADQPNIVWAGSTGANSYPTSYSAARDYMDCRAAVGNSATTAGDRIKVLDLYSNTAYDHRKQLR